MSRLNKRQQRELEKLSALGGGNHSDEEEEEENLERSNVASGFAAVSPNQRKISLVNSFLS
jgi:hypothetical protein